MVGKARGDIACQNPLANPPVRSSLYYDTADQKDNLQKLLMLNSAQLTPSKRQFLIIDLRLP